MPFPIFLNSNFIKYKIIETTVTTASYVNATGGYKGYTVISDLLPSGTIIGVCVNKCEQSSDGNRVGVCDFFNNTAIMVNAGIAATFNINATIFYI